MLLADLTCNDAKDGPIGTVKEDPADESIYPHEHFFQHYDRFVSRH
jgi:hypothetical protein